MAISARRITLEEFLKLPEEEPPLEFDNGEVTQKVSPQGKQSVIQSELCEFFNRFTRPRKLARAFSELRFTCAGKSYVPDVAIYLSDRIPLDAAGEVANTFTEPPDIAV